MINPSATLAAWLMVISFFFLLYTYVLYPLIMKGLQRLGVRYGPVRQKPDDRREVAPPRIAVVIAAHNAAGEIESKLDSCLALDYPAERLSVLVVSDGSTDETNEIVRRVAAANNRVRLVAMPTRRGKAACLNDAVAEHTESDLLLFTDSRQWLDAQTARRLVAHFCDPSVGLVSGSLVIKPNQTQGVVAAAGVYWRMEKNLRASEASVHSAIGVTGAIYAMRREAFRPIPPETILDDVLIPMTAVMNGWRVAFDQEAQAFDLASASEAQERRRKIRTLAGNYQLLNLRPRLISPLHNPVWWQFLSHKVFRLLAPLAMIVFLLANLWLARLGGIWMGLLLGQILAYAISVLPEGGGAIWSSHAMRPVRMIRGLIRLQWFAVLGLVMAFRTSQPQLWSVTQHSGHGPDQAEGLPRDTG